MFQGSFKYLRASPSQTHLTPFYQCVQDHYEALEPFWPERFEKRYGFWRPYLKEVMVRSRSKDGKEQKTYDALEWLAAMGTHVPARGQQSVRYYGFLSNAARGKRRKLQEEGQRAEAPMPTVLEPEVSAEGFGKNSAWARFIQKVYEVDPLECPRCSARMRVISFITDPAVVRRILEHLGLWLANARPVPRAHSPPDPFVLADAPFLRERVQPAPAGAVGLLRRPRDLPGLALEGSVCPVFAFGAAFDEHTASILHTTAAP